MAAKRKGLSLDEKRKRMLDLFYESKEFFQIKELEKIAPKGKGIVSQSVKEVTQSLVDDGLVECEKIGTFVCYWAFPSKAAQSRRNKLADIIKSIAETEEKVNALRMEMADATKGKESSSEREQLLRQMAELNASKDRLKMEIDRCREFDPEVLKSIRVEADLAKEGANRWTDNIFAMKKWCKSKFQAEEKTLNAQFEIPEDLDYIE